MMQSNNQFNSSITSVIPEQRDDTNELKSNSFNMSNYSREQPNTQHEYANSINSTDSMSRPIQQLATMKDHWSKRLRGSAASPSHEGYACQDMENEMNASHSIVPSMMNKIKQLPVPKILTESINNNSNTSSLHNDLVVNSHNHTSATTLGSIPRKQLLSMIQTKSDRFATELTSSTQRSWNIIMDKAEVGKNILAERAEVQKISAKLAPMFNKEERVSHTREVSFDYQLMSDVDYSSAPSNKSQ